MSGNQLADLQHQLWQAEDKIEALESERDRVFAGELIPGVLAERIGNLERDRALLLAYARARQHMVGGWTEDVSDEEFRRRGRACDEAWVALRDAGLLAGDDDDGGGQHGG